MNKRLLGFSAGAVNHRFHNIRPGRATTIMKVVCPPGLTKILNSMKLHICPTNLEHNLVGHLSYSFMNIQGDCLGTNMYIYIHMYNMYTHICMCIYVYVY